ncbi:MAG TPA: methyltransferase domain-containing protein [Gemmatimonadaceae bacterium]|jgi:SAM-dependent methyltransferase|nr:methyltransferase domain-containing protein [Gemmatimonadaceae bacterium]
MTKSVDLYDNVYSDFESNAETAVRRAAFGEDIGQSSWLTADDWLRFADLAGVRDDSRVLEVGSGSGGPAVYLAAERGCHVTGVDINAHGVGNGRKLAADRGLTDRVHFETIDASRPLPFPAQTFDAVLSNDAMCHIANRLGVLRDWHRVLRRGGRMLFTDALVMTGPLSADEIATRSSIGLYIFVPPGENERLIAAAGFTLLAADDVTADAETIAGRWHDARASHRAALTAREGESNFDGLQRFLACVRTVSAERRLSRFCYSAEKA